MKVKLYNFKCWKQREFDFGSKEGVTLLSGQSGIGKSSVLDAIYFALFGKGNKIVSHGATSCKVELEIDGLTINRSRRPNILTVMDDNNVYEDAAGQGVINKHIGENFGITSYLRQNSYNSFILMGPQDKLAFLEKFAFQGIDISKFKTKIKELIKERDKDLIKVQAELELITQLLQNEEIPTPVKFPLRCPKNSREIAMKNEYTRLKNSKIMLKKIKKKQLDLQEIKTQLRILYNNILAQNVEIDKNKEKLNLLNSQITQSEISKLEKSLLHKQSKLQQIITHKEYVVQKHQYQESDQRFTNLCMEEKTNKDNRMEEIEKDVWKEYNKSELGEQIQSYQEYLESSLRYEKLLKKKDTFNSSSFENSYSTEIKDLDSDILEKIKLIENLKLEKNIYGCPKCKCNLQFMNNLLVISSISNSSKMSLTDVKKQIKSLKKNREELNEKWENLKRKEEKYSKINKDIESIKSKYDDNLDSSEQTQSDLEYLQNLYQKYQELDRELLKLKGNNKSDALLSLEKELSEMRISLDSLENDIINNVDTEIDEEDFRKDINILQNKVNHNRNIVKNIQDVDTDIQNYQNTIEKFKQDFLDSFPIFDNVPNQEEINTKLLEFERTIQNLNESIEKHEQNIIYIEEYKTYKTQLDKFNSIKTQQEKRQTDEIIARTKLTASNILKDKINETEAFLIGNVIRNINKYAQVYLDVFFENNPINVVLCPYKEDKKKNRKPQIDIQIDYKGMECDMTSLSGGELQRVVIAFTLALAEMFNSPIMLLDECTSNLDQELTNSVVNGIKNNYSGKEVILIAHQVVSGIFDNVIKLE